jgi:hypothetical protein
MTMIDYENNGFTLEQKFGGKSYKTFVYFDNVSNKIGYYKNINYYSIIFAIAFGTILFLDIINKNFKMTLLFYTVVVIYFLYDIFKNMKKYKTLSLTNSKDIYFEKKEYKYVDEIINKRNKYFIERYFKNIETYNNEDKIYTINWLYKEEVINKFEVLKLNGIKYNEENNEFYF